MISARAAAQTTILSLVTSRVGCYGKASGFRCLQFMSFHSSKDFGLQNRNLQQFGFFFFPGNEINSRYIKGNIYFSWSPAYRID